MFRQDRISPEPTEASSNSLRSTLADFAWGAGDRVVTGVQRWLLWPLEDRFGDLGTPARAVGFGLVILLAAGAGVAGLLWAAPDGGHSVAAKAPAPAPQAVEVKAPTPEPEPTLQGAAPVFKPTEGSKRTKVSAADAIDSSSSSSSSGPSSATASTPDSTPSLDTTFSSASSSGAEDSPATGPVAGPKAIDVARDFAGAFVRYETGNSDAKVRRAFGETATPQLSRALLRRPPRLPANVKVPKAKVLNVVPGPAHGGVYTISVSLLRVGLTSELRLDMELAEQGKAKQWRVTDVLG